MLGILIFLLIAMTVSFIVGIIATSRIDDHRLEEMDATLAGDGLQGLAREVREARTVSEALMVSSALLVPILGLLSAFALIAIVIHLVLGALF